MTTMTGPLETRRLFLFAWKTEDQSHLLRLAADPRVMRYVGDGRPWPPARVAAVVSMVTEQWRAHGFGWRVIVTKDDREAVGLAMLGYLGDGTAGLAPNEVEIGWWLTPERWRDGIASEAARAICDEAFGRVGARSVVARVQPGNTASAGVASRLGMRHEFDTTGRVGEALAVYRLTAEEWRTRPGAADEPRA